MFVQEEILGHSHFGRILAEKLRHVKKNILYFTVESFHCPRYIVHTLSDPVQLWWLLCNSWLYKHMGLNVRDGREG